MFQNLGVLHAALSLCAVLALAATPAAAQDAKEAPPEPQEAGEAPPNPHDAPAAAAQSFSEAELEAFVDVAMEVQGVVKDTRAKMAGASSKEESAQLADAGNRQITAAIEAHPEMTVEKYQAIGMRARRDEAFKNKVDAMFVEAMEESESGSGGD